MRQDFSHVITTRPRVGGGFERNPYRRAKQIRFFDAEDDQVLDEFGPHKRKGLRTYTEDYKSFSDYLRPLYRSLAAQAGRPWNDVYAELNASLPGNGTQQDHVRLHVRDFVVTSTYVGEDGKVYGHAWRPDACVEEAWYQLYVHPVTGVLCKSKGFDSEVGWSAGDRRRRIEARALIPTRFRRVGGKAYATWRGHWYEVEVRPEHEETYDIVRGCFGAKWRHEVFTSDPNCNAMSYYGERIAVVRRVKQLSRKEMKRLFNK